MSLGKSNLFVLTVLRENYMTFGKRGTIVCFASTQSVIPYSYTHRHILSFCIGITSYQSLAYNKYQFDLFFAYDLSSAATSSIHVSLGRPALRTASGIPSSSFRCTRLSSIRSVCPSHLCLLRLKLFRLYMKYEES